MPIANFLVFVLLSEGAGLYGVAYLLRRTGRSLRDVGLGLDGTPGAFFWAIITAIAFCSSAIWANPLIAAWAFRSSYLKLLAIAAAAMAGLFEETLFRGYLMTALARRGQGPVVQVLASGIVFGIAHAVWGIGRPISWAFATPVASTTLLGLALGAIYVEGGRRLAPVIYCHAIIDMVIEPGLAISAFGSRV